MNTSESSQSNEIKIRSVTIDDLSAIFHLGESLFTPQAASNLYRTWDEYEVTHLFNSEPEYMFVADVEDQVVGFLLGSIIEKRNTAWNYGHLLWLGVHPDHGRQGIAGRLFDRFRDLVQAAGVRMLLIDTQADNNRAIQFFQAKGFSNPIDHVYMTLNLETASR